MLPSLPAPIARCRTVLVESVMSGNTIAPPEPKSVSPFDWVTVLKVSKKSATASPLELVSLRNPLPKSFFVGNPSALTVVSKVPLPERI